MTGDASTSPAVRIQISDNAARRIAALTAAEAAKGSRLRIAVSGGGCSGFQYGFSLDDKRNEDDRVFEHGGSQVVIDEVSLELLTGAQLDYVEDLIGSYFTMKNPNASSTCGCGSSFSV
ncbi:MAG: iron-sulfur cluster insertion protein ErpA [Rhodospirillales bacterium]|nr:iron-sulfur cluster insertion protein ErpA [Rhodospirillales bacterium]